MKTKTLAAAAARVQVLTLELKLVTRIKPDTGGMDAWTCSKCYKFSAWECREAYTSV
jgi:hypothetical protein